MYCVCVACVCICVPRSLQQLMEYVDFGLASASNLICVVCIDKNTHHSAKQNFFQVGHFRNYIAGAQLFQQNTPQYNVWLLVEGKVDVLVNDKKVYELHAGNFFGEMGLHMGMRIAQVPLASATVCAK